MKFKKCDWFDTKNCTIQYGIQVNTGDGRWRYCSENRKPLLYGEEAQRDSKLKELKQANKDT